MTRVTGTGLHGYVVAVIVHAVALGALAASGAPERKKATVRRPPVKVKLATKKPPKKAEPPQKVAEKPKPKPVVDKKAPEPPKRVAEKPKPKPKKRPPKRVAKKKPKPKRAEPPKPKPPAPGPVAPAPRRFAVNMSATVPGGGVAVPVAPDGAGGGGGSVVGDPNAPRDGRARDRQSAGDGAGTIESPVHVTEVTSAPRLLSQPSQAEMRAAYPEAARKDGREANVKLRILVDQSGRVARVRVVKNPGHGFGRAAAALVKRFRFRPARRGDVCVATWISWTSKFRLDS